MTPEQTQKIQEARAHLAVALVQVITSDDQIIVGHMREAQAALDLCLYPERIPTPLIQQVIDSNQRISN